MENSESRCLWEKLWYYDPNGLVVVDPDCRIRLVNRAFCRMFELDAEAVVGKPVAEVLGTDQPFREVWESGEEAHLEGKAYPERGLYVRQVTFAVRPENIIACITVDLTAEWRQKQEMDGLRQETIRKVHEVVDKQMKVAQEIAGLLGETTAETKTSLYKLVQVMGQEIV